MADTNLPITLDGRYLVTEQIDAGGTSKIFKATDTRLEREVAVKLMSSNVESKDLLADRFKTEAQAVAKLNHPNIVSVYDWGVYENRPYIVMEYVKGTTLKQYIKENKPLGFDEIIGIMNEVCAAILVAHDEGIIHRDIKPGNILITPNRQVKVTDFGIARLLNNPDETEVGKVLGTASYFSPEQATGKKATVKSDVYSLGIVLYELIAGFPPFKEETSVATALAHVKKQLPDIRLERPDTPPQLVDILNKSLEKNPDLRYENVNEMRKDLIVISRTDFDDEATAIIAPLAVGEDATTVIPLNELGNEIDDDAYDGYEEYQDEEYEQDDDDTDEFGITNNKTSKYALIALASIVGVGILIMMILAIASAGGDKNLGPAKVPNVVGLQFNVAREKIETAGFQVKKESEINKDIPEGEVFEQDPAPGTTLRRDNYVILKVSAGLGYTKMSDVVGKDKTEAQRLIEDEGLNISFVEESSENIKEGLVIKTSPKAGKKIKRGNDVVVTISSGPEGVTVPNVAGKDESTAANELGRLEFATKTVRENSSTVAKGKVIKTSPEAGAKVKKGTTITLYISDGPVEDTVPQVVGFTTSNASSILTQAQFTVNVVTIESTSSQQGKVLSQSPQGGATAPVGTQVTIFVGGGPSTTTST